MFVLVIGNKGIGRYICGGLTVEEVELGEKFQTYTEKSSGDMTMNQDSCIAVAGLPENNTVQVLKYCIPKMQGQGVRIAALETWSIWFSEEWSSTIISLHFADTVSGDTLVALRDNRGKSHDSGHVLEDIVSVHPRSVQLDSRLYDRYYCSCIVLFVVLFFFLF